MLEAQNIPFVCGKTDWMAEFQSNYEMQPGMPGEREEIIMPRALLSEKPENCAHSVNSLVPGRGPGGHTPPGVVPGTLSEVLLPPPGVGGVTGACPSTFQMEMPFSPSLQK